ncbi:MAG: class I SAM-dependent methyltransferase [Armatimonadetes bacterium]|nr:class I SAM-dependent methyltransferase [Armatimonadota bacterium]
MLTPNAPDSPYYNNPREDVLSRVPDRVTRSLDLGCATGGFGAAVKAKTGCEVWGIEYVPEVASVATERLDKVFVGDCTEHMRTMESGSFDLITANDVLEHLAWPNEAMAEIHRLLSPTGVFLASLPNLRYWDTLRPLFWNGEFEYEDSGIRDRTHLRFFTRKSIERWFPAMGFQISAIDELGRISSRKARLLNLVTGGRFSDVFALQYLIVAKRA